MPAPPVLGWQFNCRANECNCNTNQSMGGSESRVKCREDDARQQEEGKSGVGRRPRLNFPERLWGA